jgi:hypothetical protein
MTEFVNRVNWKYVGISNEDEANHLPPPWLTEGAARHSLEPLELPALRGGGTTNPRQNSREHQFAEPRCQKRTDSHVGPNH